MSPNLKKRLPLFAAALVGLALIVGGIVWWVNGQRWESTDNAFVQADTTLVSPQLSGRVTEVLVGDNQRVAAGQILVKLDDSDQKAQLAQAEANLAAAIAAVGHVDAQAEQEQATIAARAAITSATTIVSPTVHAVCAIHATCTATAQPIPEQPSRFCSDVHHPHFNKPGSIRLEMHRFDCWPSKLLPLKHRSESK